MSAKLSAITFRDPTVEDVKKLYELVVESTGGRTELTECSLAQDLLGVGLELPEVTGKDKCIEFNINDLKCDKPVAQAILAEVEGELVGYLIFHHHYSPWFSHGIFINDIFITPKYRMKGIARKLIQKLSLKAKEQNQTRLLFNVGGIDPELLKTINKNEVTWYRNDSTDWSVFRMDLETNS